MNHIPHPNMKRELLDCSANAMIVGPTQLISNEDFVARAAVYRMLESMNLQAPGWTTTLMLVCHAR